MEPKLAAWQADTPPGSAGLGWRNGWRIEDDTAGAQPYPSRQPHRRDHRRGVKHFSVRACLNATSRPSAGLTSLWISGKTNHVPRHKRSHCRGMAVACADLRTGSGLFRHDPLTAALARRAVTME
jgi:hypothetical protein